MCAGGNVRVVPFDDRHRAPFRTLNLAWIERDFVVEETDWRQLDDPRRAIIDPGGAIFVAETDDGLVGTCGLLRVSDTCYEVAKMAVAEEARGQGIGERLLQATVIWAREQGATRVILLSHTSLRPALALYRKHGFREVPIDQVHNAYDVCNVAMQLEL